MIEMREPESSNVTALMVLCLRVGLPELLNFKFLRALRVIPRTEKILPTVMLLWRENK